MTGYLPSPLCAGSFLWGRFEPIFGKKTKAYVRFYNFPSFSVSIYHKHICMTWKPVVSQIYDTTSYVLSLPIFFTHFFNCGHLRYLQCCTVTHRAAGNALLCGCVEKYRYFCSKHSKESLYWSILHSEFGQLRARLQSRESALVSRFPVIGDASTCGLTGKTSFQYHLLLSKKEVSLHT